MKPTIQIENLSKSYRLRTRMADSYRTLRALLVRHGGMVLDLLAGSTNWLKYRVRKPQTIVVLGMHRSGTSCITRIVNLAGASLGGPVAGANDSNPAGHWESLAGITINDLILQINGGSWDEPPSLRHCPVWMRTKMRRFLGCLHQNGTAVWKDPRTILTFPFWKPLLENYSILVTIRHPLSVARSLQRRDGFTLDKGLWLWREYNERLASLIESEPRIYLADFDADHSQFAAQLEAFAKNTGLHLSSEALASYDPTLRTSDDLMGPLDDATQALYSKLRRIAEGTRNVRCPNHAAIA